MKARLATSAMALLIALDVLLCTLWLIPLYVAGLASRPTGRQLISGYVGKARLNGHRWARVAGAVIDWIFARLGDGPAHCTRVYQADRGTGE
ncbi:hypothetical protein [Alteraurantiacibacter buctensis]|uniref:RDD domain-containing protein n=1 Tax=Alteraurantiacibacter buctensis TaxID=1503981 RepID=A0A844Z1B8_9SPHN|nr:hypothetical protein [Alteraurantiacibacter buctensis]MXO73589.1 hypothetical protein [Alteraurantiacibacter buctensis]